MSLSPHTDSCLSGVHGALISFPAWARSAVEKPDYSEAKIVVAMVGLPARGKSYLSNKLQRYLLVRLEACQVELSSEEPSR